MILVSSARKKSKNNDKSYEKSRKEKEGSAGEEQ